MMITKDGDLSEHFSRVFSIDGGEAPTISRDNGGLLMDPVIIKKGAALRLLRHLKPDKSSGLYTIHSRILIAPADSIGR